MDFVGKPVKKEFLGFGVFTGTIKSYDPSSGFFEIVYEDGDSEELELSEVSALLNRFLMDSNDDPALKRRHRRPGKSLIDNCCGDQGFSDEIEHSVDLNDGFDLNLNVDGEFDANLMNSREENHGLDLNLGFNDETQNGNLGAMHLGNLNEKMSIHGSRNENSVSVFDGDDSRESVDLGGLDNVSSRKRRKLSEKSKTTPVVRRSSRKGNAAASNQDNNSSTITNNFRTLGYEESKEISFLPPKLQLPPSSENFKLDGVLILDVFSVYAFLRSFSTFLVLSPFELEDFVAALQCECANSLIDSIHVSVLQTLRKHLELLSTSTEGSQSASRCLRDLNWALMDLITWPIFMVDYLLVHGSGLKPGFELSRLKLFTSDYYNLPVSVKIEILRCLCDDVIDMEATREEVNRRTSKADREIDYDRSENVDVFKKKRIPMDVEELHDETDDWNSDECFLCKTDGSLICCDGCPAAYHSKCVGVVSDLLPEGDWFCPECAIDKPKPWVKLRKSLRGAELLGMDPQSRLYFSSCGYLLVSDPCDAESSLNYYHRNDLNAVIEVLTSSNILYAEIVNAITKHWDIPINSNGGKRKLNLQNYSPCSKGEVKSEENSLNPENSGNLYRVFSNSITGPVAVNSEGSANISVEGQGEETGYLNYYSFARTASSYVGELMSKSTAKIKYNTVEDIIVAQLQIISKISPKFRWQNIKNLNPGVKKEKCGWCFPCRTPTENWEECVFKIYNTYPETEASGSELVGPTEVVKKGHLVDVISHILCIEERVCGLLVGPWQNPHQTKIWCNNVSKASGVTSLKHLLLTLESNLRELALSTEWSKHVESVTTVGSASHYMISSIVTSKQGISKKRAKNSDSGPKPPSNAASGLLMFWRRGGRLSRQVFNWKVLPRALASKAARQGGRMKIPGILYPDGSELAKRSRNIAWRAAVETSTSVEHLSIQVKELDLNIRWDVIENTDLVSKLDREYRNIMRPFKKVVIRRKSTEGTTVKYLLDFGKRKFIPDIVLKQGSMLEESSSGRKKYWLQESHVPLHLLKAFEENRRARKLKSSSPGKVLERSRSLKKLSRNRGFSYLFTKAEKAEKHQCGHCKKDVLIREAVSCQCCKGLFHKRHVRKLAGLISAERSYTCHKCHDVEPEEIEEKPARMATKRVKVPPRKEPPQYKKTYKSLKSLKKSKKNKKAGANKRAVQSNNDVPVGVPLRRSTRKMKYILSQKDRKRGPKKGKQKKSKNAANESKKSKIITAPSQRRRSQACYSYWLNGLWFSRKQNDKRVMKFRKKKMFFPSERSLSTRHQRKCHLCDEGGYVSAFGYISCENCGEWFHGDAFGLKAENIYNLIGFRCHTCLKKTTPICPHSQDLTIYGTQLAVKGSKSDVEILSIVDEHKEPQLNVGPEVEVKDEQSPTTIELEVIAIQSRIEKDLNSDVVMVSDKKSILGDISNSNQTPMTSDKDLTSGILLGPSEDSNSNQALVVETKLEAERGGQNDVASSGEYFTSDLVVGSSESSVLGDTSPNSNWDLVVQPNLEAAYGHVAVRMEQKDITIRSPSDQDLTSDELLGSIGNPISDDTIPNSNQDLVVQPKLDAIFGMEQKYFAIRSPNDEDLTSDVLLGSTETPISGDTVPNSNRQLPSVVEDDCAGDLKSDVLRESIGSVMFDEDTIQSPACMELKNGTTQCSDEDLKPCAGLDPSENSLLEKNVGGVSIVESDHGPSPSIRGPGGGPIQSSCREDLKAENGQLFSIMQDLRSDVLIGSVETLTFEEDTIQADCRQLHTHMEPKNDTIQCHIENDLKPYVLLEQSENSISKKNVVNGVSIVEADNGPLHFIRGPEDGPIQNSSCGEDLRSDVPAESSEEGVVQPHMEQKETIQFTIEKDLKPDLVTELSENSMLDANVVALRSGFEAENGQLPSITEPKDGPIRNSLRSDVQMESEEGFIHAEAKGSILDTAPGEVQ